MGTDFEDFIDLFFPWRFRDGGLAVHYPESDLHVVVIGPMTAKTST